MDAAFSLLFAGGLLAITPAAPLSGLVLVSAAVALFFNFGAFEALSIFTFLAPMLGVLFAIAVLQGYLKGAAAWDAAALLSAGLIFSFIVSSPVFWDRLELLSGFHASARRDFLARQIAEALLWFSASALLLLLPSWIVETILRFLKRGRLSSSVEPIVSGMRTVLVLGTVLFSLRAIEQALLGRWLL